MKTEFTIEEIERAINQSPKHNVFIKANPAIDDNFDSNISTIEVDMLLFRLFGSNKSDYDQYKNSIKIKNKYKYF